MACRASFDDVSAPVVADASVIINLNATGCVRAILETLPQSVLVTEMVASELADGRTSGRSDADALFALSEDGGIEIVALTDTELQHFTSLVRGPASETLDDGEAATIAVALERAGTALIDERKAHRICAERFQGLMIGCTIDLLARSGVEAVLGRDGLADSIFNSLQRARMSVLPWHFKWVVKRIGSGRAAACVSLQRALRTYRSGALS